MKVLVYVEGPSDRDALSTLLEPIITEAKNRSVGIRFLPLGGKSQILDDVSRKAADDLQRDPRDWIFALPDLYPMASYNGTENEHRSFHDLEVLLQERFEERANKNRLDAATRSHFRIHCLKYDLEGLLLAAPDALRQRLGTSDALRAQWRLPVEDQNDTKPPKRIVEDLFRRYRKKQGYIDTVDAPWILRRASLDGVIGACPQQFRRFVSELRALAGGREPVAPAPKTTATSRDGKSSPPEE